MWRKPDAHTKSHPTVVDSKDLARKWEHWKWLSTSMQGAGVMIVWMLWRLFQNCHLPVFHCVGKGSIRWEASVTGLLKRMWLISQASTCGLHCFLVCFGNFFWSMTWCIYEWLKFIMVCGWRVMLIDACVCDVAFKSTYKVSLKTSWL